MTQGTLKIHSENILPIIKKWLYTERDIFLRELVSNACDALSKLKMLRDQKAMAFNDEALQIDITIDRAKKTLTISDTGIGMTEEEVEKYIAQLAFSGAEEFVKQYQGEKGDPIIGHFGLGFYSSFMVSEKVEIDSLSYKQEATPAHWSCDGSPNYLLKKGEREKRGTTITLHIGQEGEEFLEEGKLRAILLKHCRFLPYPIYLSGKQVNDLAPLWIKSPSECTDREYLDFYRALYPLEPEPIFWIHLNADYPFHLQGILYFPKLNRRLDSNHASLHLYSNRVFVSDHCKDLIPDYLTALRGIIDSPDIPLNVSRSNLQIDRTVRQLANYISKKVSDKLSSTLKTDPKGYWEKWPDIEPVVKLGILQDEKFYDRVKECLIWKTSKNAWTTLDAYLERHPEKKVYYYHDETQTTHFFDMYLKRGVEILFTPSPLDVPLLSLLESKHSGVKFQRLDGGIDSVILDQDREKTILDEQGQTEAVKIAQLFKSKLNLDSLEVEAKSLSSNAVPAFLVLSEEERRMRDYFTLSGGEAPATFRQKKMLVVNTNSHLVQRIRKIEPKDPALATSLIVHLYELSLLSQRELDPKAFSTFLKRSSDLLEKLLEKVAP